MPALFKIVSVSNGTQGNSFLAYVSIEVNYENMIHMGDLTSSVFVMNSI